MLKLSRDLFSSDDRGFNARQETIKHSRNHPGKYFAIYVLVECYTQFLAFLLG